MRRNLGAALLCLVSPLLVISSGCSGFDPALVEEVLGVANAATLDEKTVAQGLREALRVGTRRAVERLAQRDGYLADELIRIRLPDEVEKMAATLRRVGFARQVDELETTMNRAAERAAGEAAEVFGGAISEMTLADAWGILRGGETAATDYFRERTWDDLEGRFRPVIQKKMGHLGLYRTYETLADTYNALPFVTRPAVDLDQHLTDKALDGLFHELAKEERKIREDPLARTTELLRRVFGAR